MTRRRLITICFAVAGVSLLAGCGGSTTTTPSTHTTATTTTTTRAQTMASGTVVLRRAVVASVRENHAASVKALWTDSVPAKTVATAGPALRALRQSVAGRRNQRIRVRTLADSLRVISTTLNPSYTTATATVVEAVRVQPAHMNGKPLGKSLRQTERVKIELHRVAGTNKFAVWKVRYVK